MFNLEVVLVAAAPNRSNPADSRFLLVQLPDGKLSLPTRVMLDTESSLECAASLLKAFLGLEARILGMGWVELHLCPLVDDADRRRVWMTEDDEPLKNERCIAVPYGCLLPEVVPPLPGYAVWLAFAEIVSSGPLFEDHLEILTAVANTL